MYLRRLSDRHRAPSRLMPGWSTSKATRCLSSTRRSVVTQASQCPLQNLFRRPMRTYLCKDLGGTNQGAPCERWRLRVWRTPRARTIEHGQTLATSSRSAEETVARLWDQENVTINHHSVHGRIFASTTPARVRRRSFFRSSPLLKSRRSSNSRRVIRQ